MSSFAFIDVKVNIISKWKVDNTKIVIDALSAINLPKILATPDIWFFVYTKQ